MPKKTTPLSVFGKSSAANAILRTGQLCGAVHDNMQLSRAERPRSFPSATGQVDVCPISETPDLRPVQNDQAIGKPHTRPAGDGRITANMPRMQCTQMQA